MLNVQGEEKDTLRWFLLFITDVDRKQLTGASFLYEITGTEVVRVDRDGFLPNQKLNTGLLIGDGIDLHFLS